MDAQFVQKCLDRIKITKELKEKDGSLYKISYWDYAPDFYDSGSEEYFEQFSTEEGDVSDDTPGYEVSCGDDPCELGC